jgi:hypothetical protein
VHVRGAAELDVVEGDRGDRVEPGADQVDTAVLGLRLERGLVDPVRTPDPGDLLLVVVEVRILDQPGRQQVGVHAPGHGRRDRLHLRPA